MDTLRMKGSTSNVDTDTENVAKAYVALSEAMMYLLPRPQLEGCMRERPVYSIVSEMFGGYIGILRRSDADFFTAGEIC